MEDLDEEELKSIQAKIRAVETDIPEENSLKISAKMVLWVTEHLALYFDPEKDLKKFFELRDDLLERIGNDVEIFRFRFSTVPHYTARDTIEYRLHITIGGGNSQHEVSFTTPSISKRVKEAGFHFNQLANTITDTVFDIDYLIWTSPIHETFRWRLENAIRTGGELSIDKRGAMIYTGQNISVFNVKYLPE